MLGFGTKLLAIIFLICLDLMILNKKCGFLNSLDFIANQ